MLQWWGSPACSDPPDFPERRLDRAGVLQIAGVSYGNFCGLRLRPPAGEGVIREAQPAFRGGARPAEPQAGVYDITTAPTALLGGTAAGFQRCGLRRGG